MVAGRLADPDAGHPDPRMAAYLRGEHHPTEALPPRIGCVAERAGRVVGYIAGHLTRRFDCDGELQYLFVSSAVRRQGVARELTRRLAVWMRQQGARRVCVNVDAESPAAGPFYLALGAEPLRPHWMVWRDFAVIVTNQEPAP